MTTVACKPAAWSVTERRMRSPRGVFTIASRPVANSPATANGFGAW